MRAGGVAEHGRGRFRLSPPATEAERTDDKVEKAFDTLGDGSSIMVSLHSCMVLGHDQTLSDEADALWKAQMGLKMESTSSWVCRPSTWLF